MRPFSIGIVGYGVAGRIFHGGLLRHTPGASVVSVVTSRISEVAADFPQAQCHPTVTAMLAAAPLDLAVVATPTAYHADHTLECLAAGVPVVVDKPMAASPDEARQMTTAAEAAGVALTVFQNRRWDSDFLTLQANQAELGTLLRFESRFERWRPELSPGKWREELPPARGGGSLLDLGSHLVDQALVLLGPVEDVYSSVSSIRGAPADDFVFLSLRHRSGAYSHLSCGSLFGATGPRMRVLGTGGALVVPDLDAQEDALRAGLPASSAAPSACFVHRGSSVAPLRSSPGLWAGFYPAVLDAVASGSPLPVDPWDAVAVLDVLASAR